MGKGIEIGGGCRIVWDANLLIGFFSILMLPHGGVYLNADRVICVPGGHIVFDSEGDTDTNPERILAGMQCRMMNVRVSSFDF